MFVEVPSINVAAIHQDTRYVLHNTCTALRLRTTDALTLNLLTTTIVAPPSNASKWQMGFNSAFKGLIPTSVHNGERYLASCRLAHACLISFIHSFILFPYTPFRYIPWEWKTSHSIYTIRQPAHGVTSIAKVEKYL